MNQVQLCICSKNYINRDKTTYLYSEINEDVPPGPLNKETIQHQSN